MAQQQRLCLPVQEMQVRSLGWEDALEESMATHSSILAWRIPWTEEPNGLQSIGCQRVGHNWAHTQAPRRHFSIKGFLPFFFLNSGFFIPEHSIDLCSMGKPFTKTGLDYFTNIILLKEFSATDQNFLSHSLRGEGTLAEKNVSGTSPGGKCIFLYGRQLWRSRESHDWGFTGVKRMKKKCSNSTVGNIPVRPFE